MAQAFELSALKDRGVRRVFLGQLLSQVCDKMLSVGLIWILTEEFSVAWVPWYTAVSGLPHLLLSPVSGKIVSRLGALRAVVLTDGLRGALFIALALAAPAIGRDHLLGALFLAALLSNTPRAIFNPAILSLPVLIAPEGLLQKVTALIDSCFSVANVLGPPRSPFYRELYANLPEDETRLAALLVEEWETFTQVFGRGMDAGGLEPGERDPECAPNEHRIFDEATMLEIVDESTGEPITETGKPGKVLLTNLTRLLMPIIRYPVGELAMWLEPVTRAIASS